MVKRLTDEGEVEGVHFCTLNLERSVRRVLEGLAWVSAEASHSGGVDIPTTNGGGGAAIDDNAHNKVVLDQGQQVLSSSPTAPFTISSAAAALAASAGIQHSHHAELTQPTAPAGDASWDEFPNGRFTDVRSPAYGELDGYGGGLKILVRPFPSETRLGRAPVTDVLALLRTSCSLTRRSRTGAGRRRRATSRPSSRRTSNRGSRRSRGARRRSTPSRARSCRSCCRSTPTRAGGPSARSRPSTARRPRTRSTALARAAATSSRRRSSRCL